MRARALAGIAVAAWSKTAMVATTSPASASPIRSDVPTPAPTTTPPANTTCLAGPMILGPSKVLHGTDAPSVDGATFASAPYKSCPQATLTLDATADNSNWKRLDTFQLAASDTQQAGSVSHACLPGTWTYRVLSIADDGSYKSSTRATFTC